MSQRLQSILQLCTLLAVGLAVPAWICKSEKIEHWLRLKDLRQEHVFSASHGVEDIPSGKALLKQNQPEWVLIGNSMLNCRIDPERLQKLSGVKPYKLTASGSKSPVWYLFFKNVVIPSGVKPHCVTIFFRDRDLTNPQVRYKRNEGMIERLEGRLQPEWKEVMGEFDAAMARTFVGIVKNLTAVVKQLMSGDKLREWGRSKLQKTAFNLTNPEPGMTASERRAELNERLSLDHQRANESAFDAQEQANEDGDSAKEIAEENFKLDLDPSPAKSFLPHMIRVAKEHGVLLHFHRVKQKPLAPDSQPDKSDSALTLPSYLEALRKYVSEQGCLYTDETLEESITRDMYVDGSHISTQPSIQHRYMDAFWHNVQPALSQALERPVAAP